MGLHIIDFCKYTLYTECKLYFTPDVDYDSKKYYDVFNK